MSGHRNFKELEAKMSPDSRARSDAKTAQVIREMPLQQLRAALSLTQTTLAETLGVTQSEVSKLERRTDIYMSTLRKFIEAMGGTLEIPRGVCRWPPGPHHSIRAGSGDEGADG